MNDDGSEELFRRLLDSISKPLLSGREEDFGRFFRFVELNDEEHVTALFAEMLQARGGREVLENAFFAMARERRSGLSTLGRALAGETTASFAERFRSEIRIGEKETRLALIPALPAFDSFPWSRKALAVCLLDRDGEIRAAASKPLFALRGAACGYDPEDPPAERETAVQELFGVTSK